MKGSDIRRYRRKIGLNQADFARRLGVTQSALSRFEAGRIAISDEHLAQLRKEFPTPDFAPSFLEFSRQLEQESQPALTTSLGRLLLLTVWQWEEGFDLCKSPPAELAAGVVAIPFSDRPTIAFRMPRAGDKWLKDEILVFVECEPEEVRPDDVCLIYFQQGKGMRTSLAKSERQESQVPPGLRLVGEKSAFVPKDAILLLLRASTHIRQNL